MSGGSGMESVGKVEAFEEGKPRRVRVNGRDLLIVRKGETFHALRDVCPHQGAPLSDGEVMGTPGYCLPGEEAEYVRDGEMVVCPWHGWQFDLRTGQSVFDPETVRVRRYEAKVVEGEVRVAVG